MLGVYANATVVRTDVIHINLALLERTLSSPTICEMSIRQPTLMRAVERLAMAGEKAGFRVEDMTQMLNAGVSLETLLDFIEGRLPGSRPGETGCSSRRTM